MTGVYVHTIDAKGRLAVPSRLREELGNCFYVTVSMEKCLHVYPVESWNAFSDKCKDMPYIKQRKMRPLFAMAAKCELDAQGRILLPPNLRSFAGIDKDAAFVGCNNHAEIWDAETWNKVNESEVTADNIASVMEELDF